MAPTPRQADYAWSTLARVLSVAKARGQISVNPCERGGWIYDADRTEKIWSWAWREGPKSELGQPNEPESEMRETFTRAAGRPGKEALLRTTSGHGNIFSARSSSFEATLIDLAITGKTWRLSLAIAMQSGPLAHRRQAAGACALQIAGSKRASIVVAVKAPTGKNGDRFGRKTGHISRRSERRISLR
jgi:hypothetical protein